MTIPHVTTERLRALMFNGAIMTEQEGDHIRGWRCDECKNVMMEVVMTHLTRYLNASG